MSFLQHIQRRNQRDRQNIIDAKLKAINQIAKVPVETWKNMIGIFRDLETLFGGHNDF